MTPSTENNKFQQVVQKLDPHSKLLRAWELKGGVSAQVTALEIERPDGQTKKMIVRQHGAVDLQHNPHIAADEFKLLQLLRSAGLATPAPYRLDQSGEIFATSYVVIEYIEGMPEFELAHVSAIYSNSWCVSIIKLGINLLITGLRSLSRHFLRKIVETIMWRDILAHLCWYSSEIPQ